MVKVSAANSAELEQTLVGLGLKRSTYRALMLLPLEHVELTRILDFAQSRLHLTPDTTAVLERWLHEPPSQAYVESGLQGLLGLALDEHMLDVDVDELPDLVVHAEAIARATADALDDPNAITPEEEVALGEIARLLEVDSGATWKRVLESLRTQRPPQAS
jgi:hypothetical protein